MATLTTSQSHPSTPAPLIANFLQRPAPLLFRTQYLWFLLVASLDVTFTWIILSLGGSEVNPVADVVIGRFGLPGMLTFKFCFVVLIVQLCEWVGRMEVSRGLFLSKAAVYLTCIPVVVAILNLLMWAADAR